METTTPVRTASSELESRIAAVLQLDVAPELELRRRAALEVAAIVGPLEPEQAEALRKMLVAVIGDVRLVVVKLAEALQRMRRAKMLEGADKRKLAIVTREVYAPLANRLGVWQVKWELEDLAFRYLQPAEYRHIAAALKVRRTERERYIEELKSRLERELRTTGIEARIEGRPKHIYSIWRKMQAKKLAFEEI